MNIKSWISHLLSRPKKAILKETPKADYSSTLDTMTQEIMGLNFKAAVEAHQNWKKRLKAVVDGNSSEELNVDVVSLDDQCILGKWIYTEGNKKFSSLPQFDQLKRNHAKFHVCAGHVLHLAQTKNNEDALKELNDGKYAQFSQQVVRDLVSVHIHARSST